jgi:hypothetical protein
VCSFSKNRDLQYFVLVVPVRGADVSIFNKLCQSCFNRIPRFTKTDNSDIKLKYRIPSNP